MKALIMRQWNNNFKQSIDASFNVDFNKSASLGIRCSKG